MPLTVECGNVVFHDGTAASAAFGREHVEIIIATVWLAFAFMEALVSKLFPALSAEEMLSVPSLLQSCHTFL